MEINRKGEGTKLGPAAQVVKGWPLDLKIRGSNPCQDTLAWPFF
jgi:hypothetical protein